MKIWAIYIESTFGEGVQITKRLGHMLFQVFKMADMQICKLRYLGL